SVLAHPAAGSFPGKGHYKEVLPPLEIVEKILPEFIEAGINGLEVYYPGHIIEHQELMKSWAKKNHLLVTGGSDCHDGQERPFGVKGISESDYNLFKAAIA
ncbi:MAG: PHP domain-containing protein, partial [Proteobacteria bacterium]|nr:PHP domain-containing protein [Pseudomonadota bacterium]